MQMLLVEQHWQHMLPFVVLAVLPNSWQSIAACVLHYRQVDCMHLSLKPACQLLPFLGCAGPPKQFAVAVGILFSIIIVVMQFTKQWEAATAFSATLCFFAGLEAFLNFCAGCLVFSYAIK